MPDVVSPAVRSRMMSGIRGKNTAPELLLRKALHRQGYRYRLHASDLPGKPDIVFRSLHAVILVHGCFWHGHDCHLFKWPSSRIEFWKGKIGKNQDRDRRTDSELQKLGWRILTVWECAIKGRQRLSEEELLHRTTDWLANGVESIELRGTPTDGRTS